MTPTDGAFCQPVILNSLLATGRAEVQANTLGLFHSIALHRGSSKYLTAQDTRITPTLTKNNKLLPGLFKYFPSNHSPHFK